jgi:hypothetical protein
MGRNPIGSNSNLKTLTSLLAGMAVLVADAAPGLTAVPPQGTNTTTPAAAKGAASSNAIAAIRKAVDQYLDRRWEPKTAAEKSTSELAAKIREAGLALPDVERLLRGGRSQYPAAPPRKQLLMVKGLVCDHVDYTTSFFLYVPASYKATNPAPLLLVGHGGNSAMSADYATQAALSGLMMWLPVVEKEGIVLAAPLSERGWGAIGNSILVSLISHLQRQLRLDPDRVYVTGHSMGGHLSWRSGIYLGDRWGAVSPMSGGYDYVDTQEVFSLVNVPGYSTFGRQEPYNINKFNLKIREWMARHDYDWQLVEKNGGHEIYQDELPKVARFLLDHPRNLYRSRVFAAAGRKVAYDTADTNDKWPKPHQWTADRPLPCSAFHWLRLQPLPEEALPPKTKQRIWAVNTGRNRIEITSQYARRARVYLHPQMVDFAQPVEIVANGQTVFKQRVSPSLETMLELVREFDDRGRLFYAAVDIEIKTDAPEMPEPKGEPAKAKGERP